MSLLRLDCEVVVPEEERVGDDVNAFRIMPDSSADYFLDMVRYSYSLRKGRLVKRLRVDVDFLLLLRDRIDEVLLLDQD
jgi:hypothetical protein